MKMKSSTIALLALATVAAAGGVYFLASGARMPAYTPANDDDGTSAPSFGVDFSRNFGQTAGAGSPFTWQGGPARDGYGVSYGNYTRGLYDLIHRYDGQGTAAGTDTLPALPSVSGTAPSDDGNLFGGVHYR